MIVIKLVTWNQFLISNFFCDEIVFQEYFLFIQINRHYVDWLWIRTFSHSSTLFGFRRNGVTSISWSGAIADRIGFLGILWHFQSIFWGFVAHRQIGKGFNLSIYIRKKEITSFSRKFPCLFLRVYLQIGTFATFERCRFVCGYVPQYSKKLPAEDTCSLPMSPIRDRQTHHFIIGKSSKESHKSLILKVYNSNSYEKVEWSNHFLEKLERNRAEGVHVISTKCLEKIAYPRGQYLYERVRNPFTFFLRICQRCFILFFISFNLMYLLLFNFFFVYLCVIRHFIFKFDMIIW